MNVMKNPLIFLLLIALIGCETSSELTTEPLILDGNDCDSCAKIHIEVPQVVDELKIAETINRAIDEELIYFLKFEGDEAISSVNEAIASFNTSYQDMIEEFGETASAWEAEVQGFIGYDTKQLVTVNLDTYSFTGGAHGYSARIYLNFDKELGEELDPIDLFEDSEGFLRLAEQSFRKQHGIAKKANINSTGFMFENDSFHLPDNIGFEEEGLNLHYNQYEVASYADGPLTFTIPFQDANAFLKPRYRVNL